MSIQLPNGATVAIASGYAAALAISAISNAFPAVATTAANTFAIGDFVELTSGWGNLTNKVVRLSAATATTATLEGIDTTSLVRFPAGGGAGSIRKVTGYTSLGQIIESGSSGGEQQFVKFQFLDAAVESQAPTIKSAAQLTFGLADDITLPGYILAKAANDDGAQRAVKITLKAGGIISHNAYVTVQDNPSLSVNALMAVQCTMSLLCSPVRY